MILIHIRRNILKYSIYLQNDNHTVCNQIFEKLQSIKNENSIVFFAQELWQKIWYLSDFNVSFSFPHKSNIEMYFGLKMNLNQ